MPIWYSTNISLSVLKSVFTVIFDPFKAKLLSKSIKCLIFFSFFFSLLALLIVMLKKQQMLSPVLKQVAQTGSLMQTDDIHSVKLLGTSWLVHVVYAANKLADLHLNGWSAFTRAFHSALSEFLWNPLPSPAPPV